MTTINFTGADGAKKQKTFLTRSAMLRYLKRQIHALSIKAELEPEKREEHLSRRANLEKLVNNVSSKSG